jgi:hypothetical protein
LAGLDHLERRDQTLLRKGLLKSQVESALRFGQPTPTAVLKGPVPLVPNSAGFMTKLRTSGQLKGDALISAVEAYIQWRACLNQVGDLAQVFKLAIAPRDYRMTELTDDDDG